MHIHEQVCLPDSSNDIVSTLVNAKKDFDNYGRVLVRVSERSTTYDFTFVALEDDGAAYQVVIDVKESSVSRNTLSVLFYKAITGLIAKETSIFAIRTQYIVAEIFASVLGLNPADLLRINRHDYCGFDWDNMTVHSYPAADLLPDEVSMRCTQESSAERVDRAREEGRSRNADCDSKESEHVINNAS